MRYRVRKFKEALPDINKPIEQLPYANVQPSSLDELQGNYLSHERLQQEGEKLFVPRKRNLRKKRNDSRYHTI